MHENSDCGSKDFKDVRNGHPTCNKNQKRCNIVPRHVVYRQEKRRRLRISSTTKFCLLLYSLIALHIILFLLILYLSALTSEIHMSRNITGWEPGSNRDTKSYIRPHLLTTLREPKDICERNNKEEVNSRLLLLVVCSAVDNFKNRIAIRETWGNYKTYLRIKNVINTVQNKYKNTETYMDINDDKQLENEELGNGTMYYDEYDELYQIEKNSDENESTLEISSKKERDFRVVFLLGLPNERNKSRVQQKIEEEINRYDDVIQEDFIDSYHNLTLKSIMMLKWVVNKCNYSVRYVVKTDDDTYINLYNLITNLRKRSEVFDQQKETNKTETILFGTLALQKRPIKDVKNKWYNPLYMYSKQFYPPYLTGPAYVMSSHTAHVLYEVALSTKYFHLEDIFITGFCSMAASPPIEPHQDVGFYIMGIELVYPCFAHTYSIVCHVGRETMEALQNQLMHPDVQDLCERKRLNKTKVDGSTLIALSKYFKRTLGNDVVID